MSVVTSVIPEDGAGGSGVFDIVNELQEAKGEILLAKGETITLGGTTYTVNGDGVTDDRAVFQAACNQAEIDGYAITIAADTNLAINGKVTNRIAVPIKGVNQSTSVITSLSSTPSNLYEVGTVDVSLLHSANEQFHILEVTGQGGATFTAAMNNRAIRVGNIKTLGLIGWVDVPNNKLYVSIPNTDMVGTGLSYQIADVTGLIETESGPNVRNPYIDLKIVGNINNKFQVAYLAKGDKTGTTSGGAWYFTFDRVRIEGFDNSVIFWGSYNARTTGTVYNGSYISSSQFTITGADASGTIGKVIEIRKDGEPACLAQVTAATYSAPDTTITINTTHKLGDIPATGVITAQQEGVQTSDEPNQFGIINQPDFINRGNNIGGICLMLLGQTNQFKVDGEGQLSVDTSASTGRMAAALYTDYTPFGAMVYVVSQGGRGSARMPQQLMTVGITFQNAEYGHWCRAGQRIRHIDPYCERIIRFALIRGCNNSNTGDFQIQGGSFTDSLVDSGNGYFIKVLTVDTQVSYDGGTLYGSPDAWVIGLNNAVIIEKSPVKSVGNLYLDATKSTGVIPIIAISANTINLMGHEYAITNNFGPLTTINANFAANKVIEILANSANGLILQSGGNIMLPSGVTRLRIPQGSSFRFRRNDNVTYKYWIAEVVPPIVRKAFNITGSITLDDLYLFGQINYAGTGSSTITLPDDTANPGFFAGMTAIPFLITNTGTLTFAAGGSASVYGVGGVLSSSTRWSYAMVRKVSANQWVVDWRI